MSDVSIGAILEYLQQFSATTAESFQKIDARLESLETRVTGVEGHIRGIESRMDRLESRIERLEDTVRNGFLSVNERLTRLEAA